MHNPLIPASWQQPWQDFYDTFKAATTETKLTPLEVERTTGDSGNNSHLNQALGQLRPAILVPASWGLSSEALVALSENPGWIERLIEENRMPPLPAKYTPQVIEIWFDEILFIRWMNGLIGYLRSCPKTYQPPLMEIYFDEQLALALVHGEVVVNRATAMARMDAVLGHLAA